MHELTAGEYTVAFELSFPSASTDHSSVDTSATSSIETISKVSTNKSADHSRSLVHMHRYNNVTPYYESGLQHISTSKHMILPDPLVGNTV